MIKPGFVGYVESLLGVIAGLVTRPEATREDKEALEVVKMLLTGKDAEDVERDLASGINLLSTYTHETFGAGVLEADGTYSDCSE